jgi:hypothetical protein
MLNRAGVCNCIPKISKQGKDRTERESYIEKRTELGAGAQRPGPGRSSMWGNGSGGRVRAGRG